MLADLTWKTELDEVGKAGPPPETQDIWARQQVRGLIHHPYQRQENCAAISTPGWEFISLTVIVTEGFFQISRQV